MTQEEAHQEPKTVLIVDDDPASRVLLRAMLSAAHTPFHIEEAYGGGQAERMIQLLRPDLVLLDIMMPDVDGISICQNAKKARETKHCKILMVTARKEERMIRAGLMAGADDYITKPFTRDQLLSAVNRLLTPIEPKKPA